MSPFYSLSLCVLSNQSKVDRKDAIFSIGRIAWLVLALQSGNVNNLRAGCEDKMHQPQRARQDSYKHVSSDVGGLFRAINLTAVVSGAANLCLH